MVSAFNITSSRDLVKRPQFVNEGDVVAAPTTYGVIPVNPAFTDVGQNSLLESDSSPVFKETRNSGDMDRVDSTKTKENHTARLMFRVTNDNKLLVKWAQNKPNGADTPDIAKTFVKSYYVAGVETYEIYKGCLPIHSEVGLDDEGFIVCIVDMICKSIDESQAANGGITLGTGAFATPSSAAGWIGTDGGIDSFTIAAVAYPEEGFRIVCDFEQAELKPSESLQRIHAKVTTRKVSGNFVIPRKDITLANDAKTGTKKTFVRIGKTGQLTCTITGAQWLQHKGSPHDPSVSAKTFEDKSFEADSLAWA